MAIGSRTSTGAYFLDLDPTYFKHILNHLRCDAPLRCAAARRPRTTRDRPRLTPARVPPAAAARAARSHVGTDRRQHAASIHNFCQTVAVTKKSVLRSVLAVVPSESDRFVVRIDVVRCSLAIGFTSKDAFDATQCYIANAAVIHGSDNNGYRPKPAATAKVLRGAGVVVAQYDRDAQKITFDSILNGKRDDSAGIDLVLPSTTELFPFVSFCARPYPDTYGCAYLGQVTFVPVPSS